MKELLRVCGLGAVMEALGVQAARVPFASRVYDSHVYIAGTMKDGSVFEGGGHSHGFQLSCGLQ